MKKLLRKKLKISTNARDQSKTKRFGKQHKSKDGTHTDDKNLNTGKWTASEQQEFNRLFALYKENKITRSQLFLSIKTRSRKQVNSHLNKIKYYLDKKFKNSETLSNKSKLMKEIELSSKPIQNKKENSIQFEDDITNKGMVLSLPLLEKIVCIQKFSRDNSGAIKLPMKIDEDILRTIAEEKLFYNMIHKRVQEDKQCSINKANFSVNNSQSIKQSTKHTNLLDATTRPNESSPIKNMRTKCFNTSTAYPKDYLHLGFASESKNMEYSERKTIEPNNNEYQRNFSNFSFKSFSKVLIDNIIQSREKIIDKKKSFNDQISEFFIDNK